MKSKTDGMKECESLISFLRRRPTPEPSVTVDFVDVDGEACITLASLCDYLSLCEHVAPEGKPALRMARGALLETYVRGLS